jgi:hypothetical protein
VSAAEGWQPGRGWGWVWGGYVALTPKVRGMTGGFALRPIAIV